LRKNSQNQRSHEYLVVEHHRQSLNNDQRLRDKKPVLEDIFMNNVVPTFRTTDDIVHDAGVQAD